MWWGLPGSREVKWKGGKEKNRDNEEDGGWKESGRRERREKSTHKYLPNVHGTN